MFVTMDVLCMHTLIGAAMVNLRLISALLEPPNLWGSIFKLIINRTVGFGHRVVRRL